MGRTAVFIDGAYVDYVLKHEFGCASIDYAKLVDEIAQGTELLRTYYYHCLPYQSSPATLEERERFSRKEKFFAALRRLPRFEVRLGKLEYRGVNQQGEPIFEQKRVDILLGVDLAVLSAKRAISDAILVTGDSDLLPAIACAKDEGVLVRLPHGCDPKHYHRELWDNCDDRCEITPDLISRILR